MIMRFSCDSRIACVTERWPFVLLCFRSYTPVLGAGASVGRDAWAGGESICT